ncbi:DUF2911 domain-containing protein [Spirosoma sp. KNUC1025]|uniref:DUF2911 domain-containing protein n=1 Tax=Spirosoma sp. KNUC1025 TaxID=2894082 RepID=UPI0038700FC7|nr:DUF2911 domain-containing protein [Spirosoma sp. KNUC1025]
MNTKQLLFSLAFLLATLTLNAQDDPSKRPSPPAQAKATVGGKTITINYSQPAVNGREIWGKLVPYGQVWRTGANETTTLEVSDNVTIEGKSLAKGRYALFTIPNEKEWTIVINKTIKWGAFSYKQDEDVLRVNVPAKKSDKFFERMTIAISNQGVVSINWANAQADFKIK